MIPPRPQAGPLISNGIFAPELPERGQSTDESTVTLDIEGNPRNRCPEF